MSTSGETAFAGLAYNLLAILFIITAYLCKRLTDLRAIVGPNEHWCVHHSADILELVLDVVVLLLLELADFVINLLVYLLLSGNNWLGLVGTSAVHATVETVSRADHAI